MKNRSFRSALALCLALLCAAAFAACAKKDAPATPDNPVQTTPAPTPPPAAAPAALVEFRLGEGTLSEPAGEVPFPLDGLLGVPAGENCPVVFLLHGLHDPSEVTEHRYYQGFSYLVEALAKQGYVTIALNTNRAFSFEPFEGEELDRAWGIFQQYRALLQHANDGEAVFDADLTGKVDLSKLNFIGHSRGGDDSLYIARQLAAAGESAVQSVLLVGAPLQTDDPIANYADVPTGMILPQYDGDVVDLSAAALFNRAWFRQSQRRSPISMAFLYGGNHNQFSTALSPADPTAPPQGAVVLDGQTQRDFLTQYATDFLSVYNHGVDLAILGETAPARYGIDFMPSLLLPGGASVLPNAQLRGVHAAGMQVAAAALSKVPERNTLAPFNHPGPLETDLPFYRLSWTQAGQALTLEVPDGDWSQWQNLTLLLANDPTNPANTGEIPAALEITLTDRSGKHAAVTLDTSTALRYLPTATVDLFADLEDLPPYFMATTHTPLGTQLLPLSRFEGVALSQIASITLTGQSDAGACIFGGLRVN